VYIFLYALVDFVAFQTIRTKEILSVLHTGEKLFKRVVLTHPFYRILQNTINILVNFQLKSLHAWSNIDPSG